MLFQVMRYLPSFRYLLDSEVQHPKKFLQDISRLRRPNFNPLQRRYLDTRSSTFPKLMMILN